MLHFLIYPEFDRTVKLRIKTCSVITKKGRNEQEKQQMIHGKIQKPTQNRWKMVLGKNLILAFQLRLLPCSWVTFFHTSVKSIDSKQQNQ